MTEKIILWSAIHIIFISIITYVWVKDCKKLGKNNLGVRDGVCRYKDMQGCLNCKRATVKELREMARKALLNKEESDDDIPF